MPKILDLREVTERANMGVSRPFICKAGPDNQRYWVKGPGAGWSRDDLCFEWIAARLAQELGLPMAEPELIRVPLEFLRYSGVAEIRDLGAGIAYGSRDVFGSQLLEFNEVTKVPDELQALIFCFDWWIQNQDRMLGPLGGNVNLLWEPAGNR